MSSLVYAVPQNVPVQVNHQQIPVQMQQVPIQINHQQIPVHQVPVQINHQQQIPVYQHQDPIRVAPQIPNPTSQALQGAPGPNDYIKHEQVTHIRACPDMYVGSMIPESISEFLYNLSTQKMQYFQQLFVCSPVLRCFIEPLSNAADNADRSWRKKFNPGSIDVAVYSSSFGNIHTPVTNTSNIPNTQSYSNIPNTQPNTIKIRNGGFPIPIEKNKDGIWPPELILGTLLTSSNYDPNKPRTGIGRNGLGAKLPNVFGDEYAVDIYDGFRGLRYQQTWTRGMTSKTPPIITNAPINPQASYVEITYRLDFEYFKNFGVTHYTPEYIGLFAAEVAKISFLLQVPCTFNGVKFDFRDIKKYACLFWNEKIVEKGFYFTQDLKSDVDVGHKYAPDVQVLILDTPDLGIAISSVNGAMTPKDGIHVSSVLGAISEKVLGSIKKSDHKLTTKDVEPHVSIIVNCHLVNPGFDKQTKTELKSWGKFSKIPIELPDKFSKHINDWQLTGRLLAAIEAKNWNKLQKAENNKGFRIHSKYEDANNAGKKDKMQCCLYLVEGNSAMTNIVKLIGQNPTNRDWIGIFPFRGKILNVKNASIQQLAENEELNAFKQVVGLREGISNKLDLERALRYGFIVMCFDADDDGKHITALLLNYLKCRFPILLQEGRVILERQAIIRAFSGAERLKFYSKHQYEQWSSTHPNPTKFRIEYYKGLGTSDDADIKDDAINNRKTLMLFDEKAPSALDMVFDQKCASQRKPWISNWHQKYDLTQFTQLPISTFILEEYVEYAKSNLKRAIPHVMDGFKEVLRKAIWYILNKNLSKPIVVDRLVSAISEYTLYHHGPISLQNTINGLVADFVGSNNLPYLQPKGQFGTRREGGKDAAAGRYPKTLPEFWLKYMFKKEDFELCPEQKDEGEIIEPQFLLPILPLMAINGMNGVAVGYSTFGPNYHPLGVALWFKVRNLADLNREREVRAMGSESNGAKEIKSVQQLPSLTPWYRGFRGKIEVVARYKKTKEESLPTEEEESDTEEDDVSDEKLNQIEEKKMDEKERLMNGSVPNTQPNIPVSHQQPNVPLNTHQQSNTSQLVNPFLTAAHTKIKKLSMVTSGCFHMQGSTVVITELPIGRWTKPYREWLEELHSEGKINKPRDLSTHDKVHFELTGLKFQPSLHTLKLVKSYGMSNICMLDMNGSVRKFEDINEYFEYFYGLRLSFYAKRKEKLIRDLETTIAKLTSKKKFFILVDNGTILLTKQTPEIRNRILDESGIDKSVTEGKIKAITPDGIAELEHKIQVKQKELELAKLLNINEMWIADIDEFVGKYSSHYGKE